MNNEKKVISTIFFALVMIFFYLPIVMLVVLSFNESKTYMWTKFSLKWYKDLFLNSPHLWVTFV